MNVYFSGISGTGIGPLAELAVDAGFTVFGSDRAEGVITKDLRQKGIDLKIGDQDGSFLRQKYENEGIDWFVYTSALPSDHPELLLAKELGIKTTKRDSFLSHIIAEHKLNLVAIAGTHGKTTTTAMIIWACHKLVLPISYLVGSSLPWAASAKYSKTSNFFVYEADEYDRNFLEFHPWLSIITTETYDHADTYKTPAEYREAFAEFKNHSEHVISTIDALPVTGLTLAGELRRYDAQLAFSAVSMMALEMNACLSIKSSDIISALNSFPGAGRRFEQIAPGAYSDYAHHPEEVAATVAMARELVDRDKYAGLIVVYEPHQNTRQHQVKDNYKEAFAGVDKLFWLPTYLTREDPKLKTITPKDFIAKLDHKDIAEPAEANDQLAQTLKDLHAKNNLIILMTAGPADTWFRQIFTP
ncbi:Mur ligase domain-containing protein [Candidatus Saccharibacteria bacterium]|nr:Mur ligase domain-containing protein [Candidatus Saccharibacteria bacterium]